MKKCHSFPICFSSLFSVLVVLFGPQVNSAAVPAVSPGGNHSLLLHSNGSLWVTGANDLGQLGTGKTGGSDKRDDWLGDGQGTSFDSQRDEVFFSRVLDANVSAISAGEYHSLFLKTDGSLWAMGENSFGQLGDGNAGGWSRNFDEGVDRKFPVKIFSSVFVELNELTLSSNGYGALSVSGNVASVSRFPYSNGDTVTVGATPSSGFVFMGWSGDHVSDSNETTFVITADMDVNATFLQEAAFLYVQDNPGEYSLYTETEKNASAATANAAGITEGNASGIA